MATLDILGPFEVVKRPLTLPRKDVKPPTAGESVAWWKLDEADGSEVSDASGNRHSAQARGAPRWGSGPAGGALGLDGAKDYVDCGDSADFDFSKALTVSLWLKVQGLGESSQTLIGKGGNVWRIQTDGTKGNLLFTLKGPRTTGKDKTKPLRATSDRSVDDGQWHNVVGVYDDQQLALYLDGELEDSVTASGLLALSTEPVWLGDNPDARGEFFNGWLDDVRLYDRALNPTEIKALYGEAGK